MSARVISHVNSWMVFDSRGQPTVCAEVVCDGVSACAFVPSGASTGQFEACELRDGGHEFSGKGVKKAINNIRSEIAPALVGVLLDPMKIDQLLIDLDGTEQKENLGANAILAVSMATWRLFAKVSHLELFQVLQDLTEVHMPTPMLNVINGGAHASNSLDVQEFMIVPKGFSDMKEALSAAYDITSALRHDFKNRGVSTAVGDEGGFAPNCFANSGEVIEYLVEMIAKCGFENKVFVALDIAASEFYDPDKKLYHLEGENLTYDRTSWVTQVSSWISQYNLLSVEDPFADIDLISWSDLQAKHGDHCQIVGDDIFVTQIKRLRQGIARHEANSVLIKPNQVGTVLETLQCIDLAKENNFSYIISHRSGDTEDAWISDLAVATGAKYIKTGALCRSERVAKYNRLLTIEEKFGVK